MPQLNWSIIGHQNILEFLEKTLLTQKFFHAYLFAGPKKVGKTITAKTFVKFLICSQYKIFQDGKIDFEKSRIGCGHCQNCQQFAKGIYPDFYLLEREFDEKTNKKKQNITVAQVRALQAMIHKRSFLNSYKIVLIPEAESLTVGASNSLLKILEEPTAKTIFILIATNHQMLLPTIQSRCQILRFMPVASQDIYDYLIAQGAGRDLAKELSSLSLGRPTTAMKYFVEPKLYNDYKQQTAKALMLLTASNLEKFKIINEFFNKYKGKDKPIALLDNLSCLVRDVQMLNLYKEELVSNLFLLDQLKRLQKIIGQPHQLLRQIEKAKFYINKNITSRFVFENLLIR